MIQITEKSPYDGRFLTPAGSRFDLLVLPRGLRLFDSTLYDGKTSKHIDKEYIVPYMIAKHLQASLEKCSEQLDESKSISIQVARIVSACKRSCQEEDVQHSYSYLYTMSFRGHYYHFFRDETTECILSLTIVSQVQSKVSFLCVEGERVLALICEGNRPGEQTEAATGASLEALLPHIDNQVPLPLSTGNFQIIEVLGEGFESVVFKVKNQTSGTLAALKVGKLALQGNFQALQPLLASIRAREISVPLYRQYEAHYNGILMEYSAGECLTCYIERMEQQQKPLFELLEVYKKCLLTLSTLKASLHLSHGDAHDANWLIDGDTLTLLDFRHSATIPFTSLLYQQRDCFAMLCLLYRLIYGRHPKNRQEVKQALMLQQHRSSFEHPDVFPPLHYGNRYDLRLQQFLYCSVYTPQAYTLKDTMDIVSVYLRGFHSTR